MAVQDAVLAQFGDIASLRAFNRMRRARNRFEYPDSTTIGPTTDDVDDAIASAGTSHVAAVDLVKGRRLSAWAD